VHLAFPFKLNNDGTSPMKEGVTAHTGTMFDDPRFFFRSGVSSEMRLMTVWGKESRTRNVAFLRTRMLHDLTNTTFRIHENLTFSLTMDLIGSDSKMLGLELYLTEKHRCGMCRNPDHDWSSCHFATPKISVGKRQLWYMDVIDTLVMLIERGVVKNLGKVSVVGSIRWAWSILKPHAGCNAFSTHTHGNLDAHVMMMKHLATRMGFTDQVEHWSESERAHVEHRYATIMTFDAQLCDISYIYELLPGYDITDLHVKVPTLHGVMRRCRSIMLDIVLNLVPGGAARNKLSNAFLSLISPNQTWYSHFYAWMMRRMISCESAWDGAPMVAQQVRMLMYSLIAICRLRDHTPARFIKLAVSCALLDPFLRSKSGLRYAPSGITAVAGGHKAKDLTLIDTLWKHTVEGHLVAEIIAYPMRSEARASEESTEKAVGEMKAAHVERGAHNKTDLTWTEGVQSRRETHRARFTRKTKRHAMTMSHDPATRGTILVPTLSALKGPILSLIEFVQQYDGFIHYRGDVVIISGEPVPDTSWEVLLQTFDILCGCTADARCECHAHPAAHPSQAFALPEWLIP
jgi:hypothetical protein